MPRNTKSIQIVKVMAIVTAVAGTSCLDATTLPPETPQTRNYAINVKIRIDPAVFAEYAGLPQIQPFDEALLTFWENVAPTPASWTFSESRETRTSSASGSWQTKVYPSLILHPGIDYDWTIKVNAPGYVCALAYVFTGRNFKVGIPDFMSAILSSSCAAFPPDFENLTIEEAQAAMPAPGAVFPEPAEIVLNTVVHPMIFYTQTDALVAIGLELQASTNQ